MCMQHLPSQAQPIEMAVPEMGMPLSQAPQNACLQPAWRSVLAMGLGSCWPLLNMMVVLAVGGGRAIIWVRKSGLSTAYGL